MRNLSLEDRKTTAALSPTVSYSASASFLAYLLATRGAVPLKQIYYAGSSGFARRFREAYGQDLESAERDWLAFTSGRAARSRD